MGCWGVWRRRLPCRPEGQVCWAQESRGPTWPSVLSGTHWAITPSPFSFPGVTASFLARSSPPTSGLLDLPWTFASLSGRHSHSITLSPCAYQPGYSTNTIPCWIPKVSAGWWERVWLRNNRPPCFYFTSHYTLSCLSVDCSVCLPISSLPRFPHPLFLLKISSL